MDRLVVKEGAEKRLADSLATALNLSDGIVKVEIVGGEELVFSEKFACVECGLSYPEISPRMFSFNNPYGACPECDGLGTTMYFDPDLVVPNKDLSIREGAVIPWQGRNSMHFHQTLDSLAGHYRIDLYAPFKTLSPQVQKVMLYGSNGEQVKFYSDREDRRQFYYREFEGLIPQLERRYRETDSEIIREEMQKYMNIRPCPVCKGARLRKESLFVKVGGLNIHQVAEKSIRQALDFFTRLELAGREKEIARRILKEISERLGFLLNVGLDYLTLGGPPPPSPGGNRSGSAWPRRSGPGWWESCTSWTSPASAFTSATTPGCFRLLRNSGTWATPSSSLSTTRRRFWSQTTSWTSARERGSKAARWSFRGPPGSCSGPRTPSPENTFRESCRSRCRRSAGNPAGNI